MKPYFQPFVQPSPSARNYISPDPYEPRPRLSRGSINFVEEFRPRCGSAPNSPNFLPQKYFRNFRPAPTLLTLYTFHRFLFSFYFILFFYYFFSGKVFGLLWFMGRQWSWLRLFGNAQAREGKGMGCGGKNLRKKSAEGIFAGWEFAGWARKVFINLLIEVTGEPGWKIIGLEKLRIKSCWEFIATIEFFIL